MRSIVQFWSALYVSSAVRVLLRSSLIAMGVEAVGDAAGCYGDVHVHVVEVVVVDADEVAMRFG